MAVGENSKRCSGSWGDYDGDGDLDLVIVGKSSSGPVSIVYRNDAGTFTDAGVSIPSVGDGSVDWGDYDGDGDLDLLLVGTSKSVYRNEGGSFIDAGINLVSIEEGRKRGFWGDYDGDGDLDILLGKYIYTNEMGVFNDMPLVVVNYCAREYVYDFDWGDYDGDGDLDVVYGGYGQNSSTSVTYFVSILRSDLSFSVEDMRLLLSGYGSGGGLDDLNIDGRVNMVDFALGLSAWFRSTMSVVGQTNDFEGCGVNYDGVANLSSEDDMTVCRKSPPGTKVIYSEALGGACDEANGWQLCLPDEYSDRLDWSPPDGYWVQTPGSWTASGITTESTPPCVGYCNYHWTSGNIDHRLYTFSSQHSICYPHSAAIHPTCSDPNPTEVVSYCTATTMYLGRLGGVCCKQ